MSVLDKIKELLENGTDNIQANELAKKITLLDVIHLLTKGWTQVIDVTIRNCFQNGGFITPSINEDYSYDSVPLPIPNNIPKTEFEEWLTIDDDLQTASTLTEEDICSQVMTGSEELDDNGDDDEDDDSAP